jgi:hypothetical protein
MHFDIVHASDPRFLGGTSSALRSELKAARRYGVDCALLPFVGRGGKLVRAFERRTAELLDKLSIPWLTGDETVTCGVLYANHPQVFERMPAVPVRVRPRRVVCVAQHPPFDGFGARQYDFKVVQRNLERMFDAPVLFAPVGPKVRSQFENLVGQKPVLTRRDLFNMIDMVEWSGRMRPPPQRTAIVGRHSRDIPLKWPDSHAELLAAYPDQKHLSVQSLGGVPPEIAPWLGSNWSLLPFLDEGVAEFLSRLDFYVYFHSRRWVEAFGIGIAEAMASGLVTILEPSYESLFAEGAVYTDASGTANLIDKFIASPRAFAKQSAAARKLAAAKFSIETYPARMLELCDDLEIAPFPALDTRTRKRPARQKSTAVDRAERCSPRANGPRRRVLFVATNGVGLGHITRLMAIAERMSPDVEPIFFTRSAGSALIRERGHAVDFIPWTVKLGVTDSSWNVAYGQELLAAIECMDISAVVFDGTYPFPGLINVASVRPDLAWIWVRRSLWIPGQALDEAQQSCFDMIIEPGELAHDEDVGPTRYLPGPVIEVPPILLVDPGARLSRNDAAARLGIDPNRFTVAVQLGSQSNFDFEDVPRLVMQDLVRRGLQIVQIDNPLARPTADEWPSAIRRNLYPDFGLSRRDRSHDCQRRLQQLSRMRFRWRAGDLCSERSS